jgi:DNA-binding transcriptional regulator YhcF (GntR family)
MGAAETTPDPVPQATARVRERLLLTLHFGQRKPGDRAPSIRTMSRVTGISRKCVHRAYEQLADEGLLELRPGSGTFFASAGTEALRVSLSRLLETVARFREEARELGVGPDELARLLAVCAGRGPVAAKIAVTECNREQLGLMARELGDSLGAPLRPVLLDALKADPHATLDGCVGVITTDCHKLEVEQAVRSLHLPVYRVALDHRFTEALVDRARRGPVLAVVEDGKYGPIFLGMLERMGEQPEIIDRFSFAEPEEFAPTTPVGRGGRLYVSPLVEHRVKLPPGLAERRVDPGPYLDATSIEHLKTLCAAQVALNPAL